MAGPVRIIVYCNSTIDRNYQNTGKYLHYILVQRMIRINSTTTIPSHPGEMGAHHEVGHSGH